MDVLIIGAGPTGLTLACGLALRGVDVRIIDASPRPPAGSRGKGLQPRSLELFDDLGIAARVIAHGRFAVPIRRYDDAGNSTLDDLHEQRPARLDAPYAAPLLTPQWRVEEALRGKLEELGVRVEFGVELTGFEQDGGGVTARLRGADDLGNADGPVAARGAADARGVESARGADGATTARARWLVGCDGGKSTVRHLAGIAFLGETIETYRMLLGDVRVSGLDRDHWHIWRSAEGFLALCPLPSTESFQLQISIAPGQESEPALETFQRLVERRTHRTDIRLSDPTWMSLWRANVRMVDRYREGSVFLAGDAAHVHSPAGGQGMNTGIQDAYNLAWKIAAVKDGADAALLDTYQQERLPIAAWVLGVSNDLMAASVKTGTIAFNRDEQTLQLGLGYRGCSLALDARPEGEGLRAGDRAPDAPGLIGPDGACRMFDLLRGPHVTLLGFGPAWEPLIKACVARFAGVAGRVRGYVIVTAAGSTAEADSAAGGAATAAVGSAAAAGSAVAAGGTAAGGTGAAAGGAAHYIDAGGHARAAYAGALFVVRPDNYVGMATTQISEPEVMAYLEKVMGPSEKVRVPSERVTVPSERVTG